MVRRVAFNEHKLHLITSYSIAVSDNNCDDKGIQYDGITFNNSPSRPKINNQVLFQLSAATFHNQFIYKMPRGTRQHQNKYWSHFTIIDSFNFAKEMWTIGPDSNLNVISENKVSSL